VTAREAPDTLGLDWRRSRVGELDAVEVLTAPGAPVAVYLHGGGYTGNSADSTAANAALLARATGRRVISLDYPLAPGSTYPETTRLVVGAHRALLAAGIPAGRIAYVGDSAGGGLAAGSVLRMLDEGVEVPARLALLSPWTDLTAAGDSRTTLAPYDPVSWDALSECAKAYAGVFDLAHPYASPVYGSFGPRFPATLVQAGTREILMSDAVRLYQAVRSSGGTALLDLHEAMGHIWMFDRPDAPEGRAAFAAIASFLADGAGAPLSLSRPGSILGTWDIAEGTPHDTDRRRRDGR
jgi:monoterpene epsilon-lactone hydrolase